MTDIDMNKPDTDVVVPDDITGMVIGTEMWDLLAPAEPGTEVLLRVARILEVHPERHNQGLWFSDPSHKEGNPGDVVCLDLTAKCNSTGCAAGWGMTYLDKDDLTDDAMDAFLRSVLPPDLLEAQERMVLNHRALDAGMTLVTWYGKYEVAGAMAFQLADMKLAERLFAASNDRELLIDALKFLASIPAEERTLEMLDGAGLADLAVETTRFVPE